VKTLRNKKQTGFTLIELLVVIAIIGLLASVVLLSLNSARAKSRDAKRLADVRQFASALELFFNDNGGYPIASPAGSPYIAPTYIGLITAAPTPSDGTCSTTINTYAYTPGGTQFTATYANGGGSLSLYATYNYTFCLGNVTGGYGASTHTLSPAGIQ